ncbi:MAG: hypothetical protein K0S25_928 [Bacillus sp. (in: firmicutes)]|jgi:hypothetical protein|nr:hypothetical protein [Bacillus sp. (in: firmicutes)]
MSKLRVWWIPQVPMESFYVPVNSVLEGKKVIDMLSAYDAFQLQRRVKVDYTNTSGLQEYNDETGEWEDWYSEWGDDLGNHCESNYCVWKEEVEEFTEEIFKQIDWKAIENMTK